MSELKVNTITPAAGNQVTVAGQVLGVPGTEPYHFATVSQLGGGGAGGISRAEAQELVTTGVASANLHSDEKDQLQNTSTTIAIGIAKTEAVSLSKEYTDGKIGDIVQGDYFNNVEMPNWTYQTTWTNDAGETGPRIEYNKFNTNRFDSKTTGKFQIAGINGISVTGATGYDTMTTGTGGTELIPYQRVIVDGSGAKVPSWTSATNLGIGSILIVRSATVNGGLDYSYAVGTNITGVIKYYGSGAPGRYVYNGSIGTTIEGTWRVVCWSSDDSGNPSSQFLAQRIS